MIKITLRFVTLTLCWLVICGFVFEHNPPAKIDASPNNPTIYLHLANDLPALEGKDEVNPLLANLSDAEFWPYLVQTATSYWNSVDAAYIDLQLATERDGTYDENDRMFSIVSSSDLPVTAAADALPSINSDNIIEDCDIRFPNAKQNALSTVYTLVHELGHCLGLGHNHIDTHSVMSYNAKMDILKLGAQDIAALIYLYPAPKYNKKLNNFAPCGGVFYLQTTGVQTSVFLLLSAPLFIFCSTRLRKRRTQPRL